MLASKHGGPVTHAALLACGHPPLKGSHVRSRVRGSLLCALAALALSAGCTSDGPIDEPDPSISPSVSEESSPTDPATGGTEGTDGTDQTAAPADGPTVEAGPLTYRLVDDVEWSLSRQGQSAYFSDVEGAWYVSSGEGSSSGADLDQLAEVAIGSTGLTPPPERLDDRVVAGVPCYVFERTGKDGLYYEIGAVVGPERAYLRFEFPVDSPETRAWVEQVLASAEWS